MGGPNDLLDARRNVVGWGYYNPHVKAWGYYKTKLPQGPVATRPVADPPPEFDHKGFHAIRQRVEFPSKNTAMRHPQCQDAACGNATIHREYSEAPKLPVDDFQLGIPLCRTHTDI